MLLTSQSPSIGPALHIEAGTYSSRPQYDQLKPAAVRSSANHPEQIHKYHFSPYIAPRHAHRTTSLDRFVPKPKMVDAGTQYSPQNASTPPNTKPPTSTIAGLHLAEEEAPNAPVMGSSAIRQVSATRSIDPATVAKAQAAVSTPAQPKRQAVEPAAETPPTTNGVEAQEEQTSHQSPVKKARPDAPPVRLMPVLYENCNTRDLVVLISSMLMELIRYNDAIPLREGQLTRFHSRAPPGISVLDYLQRLTTHATLSPPILLSVVYYIDRLCALYPAFTISSLTVHRFLITSATVASKGLSDSFWTNKTYARVGGVSMKELALLELEFLTRMEWRIVPKPEVLCDYYKSLIERNAQYQLES